MSFQEGDVSRQANRKAQVTSVATPRSRAHTFAMGPCSYCKTPSPGSEEQPRAGHCFLSEEYGGLPKSSRWWWPALEFSLWTHSVTGEQLGCLNIDGLCHLRCPRVSKSSTCTWQTPDPDDTGFVWDLCLSGSVARGQVWHLVTSKMPSSFMLGNWITL